MRCTWILCWVFWCRVPRDVDPSTRSLLLLVCSIPMIYYNHNGAKGKDRKIPVGFGRGEGCILAQWSESAIGNVKNAPNSS